MFWAFRRFPVENRTISDVRLPPPWRTLGGLPMFPLEVLQKVTWGSLCSNLEVTFASPLCKARLRYTKGYLLNGAEVHRS